ncbi:MAG: hypothetical protein AUH79_02615 [Betaproteobacteria bacterium 13_1_40CM_4_64_4]|nr:MAG: hypothetical protein AUH79_02615 [Betaproteobacteria bacterium 13_1_40CM_4_64_4]
MIESLHAAIEQLQRMPHPVVASLQLETEAASFGACSATDDFVEGVRAFLDKRPPRFDGEEN